MDLSLVAGDEGSYLPNGQSNLVIALNPLSIFFYPCSCRAPRQTCFNMILVSKYLWNMQVHFIPLRFFFCCCRLSTWFSSKRFAHHFYAFSRNERSRNLKFRQSCHLVWFHFETTEFERAFSGCVFAVRFQRFSNKGIRDRRLVKFTKPIQFQNKY